MAKLQPNFSWQKYQNEEQDEKEQFQYQLQQQHILVANSMNTTIDDLSYFNKERQTSIVWVTNVYLWTITVPTVMWTVGNTVNSITVPISGNFTVVDMQCVLNFGQISVMVPNLNFADTTQNLSIIRNGTNVTITSNGYNYSSYSGYVTLYYTKP
jgi:hypothetical protein